MIACFGLHDGWHPSYFPANRLAENRPRLDIWALLRAGALTEGTETELQWEDGGCRLASRSPNLWIEDGAHRRPILIAWDEPLPGVARPWFECPVCHRRCRHVYLIDPIACRKCHRLDYASRHLYRQTPAVHRVARLRRKLGDCDTRPFAPLPERGRGRSRGFHEKLVAQIHVEEAKLVAHLGSIAMIRADAGDAEGEAQGRRRRANLQREGERRCSQAARAGACAG